MTNSYITCLEEDLYNCIWVGTKNGINIIDKDFKIAYSQTKIYENKLFIYPENELENQESVFNPTSGAGDM